MPRQFSVTPFRALQDRRLRPSDKLALAALGGHTDTTGRCWPSIAKLMECSGLRERTVQRALKRLEEAGYLQIERREGRSTVYRVLFDTPDNMSPVPLDAVTPVPSGTHNVSSNVSKESYSAAESALREHLAGMPDALEVVRVWAGSGKLAFGRWAAVRRFGPGGTQELSGVAWEDVGSGLLAAVGLLKGDDHLTDNLIAGCIRTASRQRREPAPTPRHGPHAGRPSRSGLNFINDLPEPPECP